MLEPHQMSAGRGPGSGVSRRMFLELSVAGAVAAGAAARLGVAQETQANGMPYRTLGRTGEKVSLVGIGGAHLGRLHDEQEAIRIVRTALDSGVNFMDDAAKEFRPLSDSQLTALKAKTARVAVNGKYELYKTSDHFDSTGHHPEWLG